MEEVISTESAVTQNTQSTYNTYQHGNMMNEAYRQIPYRQIVYSYPPCSPDSQTPCPTLPRQPYAPPPLSYRPLPHFRETYVHSQHTIQHLPPFVPRSVNELVLGPPASSQLPTSQCTVVHERPHGPLDFHDVGPPYTAYHSNQPLLGGPHGPYNSPFPQPAQHVSDGFTTPRKPPRQHDLQSLRCLIQEYIDEFTEYCRSPTPPIDPEPRFVQDYVDDYHMASAQCPQLQLKSNPQSELQLECDTPLHGYVYAPPSPPTAGIPNIGHDSSYSANIDLELPHHSSEISIPSKLGESGYSDARGHSMLDPCALFCDPKAMDKPESQVHWDPYEGFHIPDYLAITLSPWEFVVDPETLPQTALVDNNLSHMECEPERKGPKKKLLGDWFPVPTVPAFDQDHSPNPTARSRLKIVKVRIHRVLDVDRHCPFDWRIDTDFLKSATYDGRRIPSKAFSTVAFRQRLTDIEIFVTLGNTPRRDLTKLKYFGRCSGKQGLNNKGLGVWIKVKAKEGDDEPLTIQDVLRGIKFSLKQHVPQAFWQSLTLTGQMLLLRRAFDRHRTESKEQTNDDIDAKFDALDEYMRKITSKLGKGKGTEEKEKRFEKMVWSGHEGFGKVYTVVRIGDLVGEKRQFKGLKWVEGRKFELVLC